MKNWGWARVLIFSAWEERIKEFLEKSAVGEDLK